MEGWRIARAPGVHGFLVGPRSTASARRLLMDGEPVVVERDPSAYSARVEVAGTATGTLLGGNLSALAHMAGAGLPGLTGAILLLEDFRGMGLGRVDRQLTQLRRAGALDGLAGVALGLFTGFDEYVDRGWTLAEVLIDHLEPLGVPVLGGLPIGHAGGGPDDDPDQVCVAIGGRAVLDVGAGTLVSEPAAFVDGAAAAGEGSRADVINRVIRREMRRREAARDARVYAETVDADLDSDAYAAWSARAAGAGWSDVE